MVQLKGDPKRLQAYVAGGPIKIGDFVMQDSAGKVVVAAASEALLGVSMANVIEDEVVQISDHPDQMYRINASAAMAQTDVHMNANIVANTTSGVEGNHTLDQGSLATTATLPLKVVGLSQRLGADDLEVIVKINNDALQGGTGTVGV